MLRVRCGWLIGVVQHGLDESDHVPARTESLAVAGRAVAQRREVHPDVVVLEPGAAAAAAAAATATCGRYARRWGRGRRAQCRVHPAWLRCLAWLGLLAEPEPLMSKSEIQMPTFGNSDVDIGSSVGARAFLGRRQRRPPRPTAHFTEQLVRVDVRHPSRISHGRHVRRDLRGHGHRRRDSPERGAGTGSMSWQVGSASAGRACRFPLEIASPRCDIKALT